MSAPHYLPTSEMRLALVEFRRPFAPQAVRFRVAESRPGEDGFAMVVTYVDVRLVIERLNVVVGEGWSDAFQGATCALTVLGVTRSDVGEATGALARAKALRSDALKRAAVKFGIGVHLYAAPRMVLEPKHGLAPIAEKPYWSLERRAETRCRRKYAEWLRKVGVKSFGESFDHGDLRDAQGDWELAVRGAPAMEAHAPTDLPLLPEQHAEIQQALAGLDESTVGVLCTAANVDSVEELTQATLPAFVQAAATLAGDNLGVVG